MLKVISFTYNVHRCVSIVNFSRFASVKENVVACTSNLKDIILIPFYCIGIGVLVNIHLRI